MFRSPLVRAAAFVISLATLAGCGDDSNPAAPTPQRAAAPPLEASYSFPVKPGGHYPVLHRSAPLAHDVSVSGTIGGSGGMLSIPAAGLYVIFPSKAVKSKTLFTLTAHAGPWVTYTFEPHIAFDQPVAIVQDLSLTKAANNASLLASLGAGYLPNDLADIDAGGTGSFSETYSTYLFTTPQAVPSAYAAFVTTHFSGYAFASGCQKPASLGGE